MFIKAIFCCAFSAKPDLVPHKNIRIIQKVNSIMWLTTDMIELNVIGKNPKKNYQMLVSD